MSQRPDFQRIKNSLSIEAFLRSGGWLPMGCRSDSLLAGCCPIHGGDNPRAFVVWRRHNRWRCFTRCLHGGDLIDLAAALWRCPLREAAVRLTRSEALSAPPTQSEKLRLPRSRPFRPFRWRIPLHPDASFLRHKGITAETARAFDVGLYSGSGWLRGCMGVRLFDPEGHPLGYAGRVLAPLPNQPKWRFPPGLPAGELLYNYHRVVASGARACALVECPWGVLRLHQVGLPAVALMGVGLSERQRQLLLHFERVLLLLDGDPAGQEAAIRLRQRLDSALEVRIHTLPTGLDPDDLSPEALARLRPHLDVNAAGAPTGPSTSGFLAKRPRTPRPTARAQGVKNVESGSSLVITPTGLQIETHPARTSAQFDLEASDRTA